VATVDARAALDAPAATALDRRLERLPEGHPSSPGYPDGPSDRGLDTPGPLTDVEHAEHVADVKARLEKARAAGLDTKVQHTLDAKQEIWSDEREDIHDAIIDDLYAAAATVPRDGEAILAGGLAGSGKTTVLARHAGIDLSRYLMINPDLIKEEMSQRGLVPEVEGLSPMEASDLVHEECSYIAKRLARRAEADRCNLIWDITMSTTTSAQDRINALRGAGYSRVDGIFVDIPIEVSVRRADSRHREDHEKYRSGIGLGGRLVPEEVTLAQADAEWGSRNRAAFEKLKESLDAWSRYDNSVDGRAPVLVEAGIGSVDDGRRPT